MWIPIPTTPLIGNDIFTMMELIGTNSLFCKDEHYQWVHAQLLNLDVNIITPQQWECIALFEIDIIPEHYLTELGYIEACIRNNYIHRILAIKSNVHNVKHKLSLHTQSYISVEMGLLLASI